MKISERGWGSILLFNLSDRTLTGVLECNRTSTEGWLLTGELECNRTLTGGWFLTLLWQGLHHDASVLTRFLQRIYFDRKVTGASELWQANTMVYQVLTRFLQRIYFDRKITGASERTSLYYYYLTTVTLVFHHIHDRCAVSCFVEARVKTSLDVTTWQKQGRNHTTSMYFIVFHQFTT